MLIRYEATFEGLLTAAAVCLRSGCEPELMVPDLGQLTLLLCTDVAAEAGIRALFRRHLAHVLGSEAGTAVFDNVYAAFLSDDEGIGLPIYRYLAAALRAGSDPSGNLLDRDVARVVSTARRVRGQAHAYLGLIRFRQISPDLYLSDFTPDYHILPLILPHFCERLPDQPFVIRDLRRDLAALHVPGKPVRIFVLAPPDGLADESASPQPLRLDEAAIQPALPLLAAATVPMALAADTAADSFDQLWRRYLTRLSIPERRNLKLQKANMPKKYWKYLTEQPGGL